MRCNNCGWENPNNLTKCEKCNAPLQGIVNNQCTNGTAIEANVQASSFRKTVCEHDIFPQESNVCPVCGYPMRPGVKECPNCAKVEATSVENRPVERKNMKPSTGTVNPWIQVASVNKCRLQPVEQQGVDTPNALELKGDSHELNRKNLDPDNMTITSNVQAELVYENGTWYIKDKSAQHTTFVYAGEKTALKERDVILMGNRQFVFHIEEA